MTRSSQRTLLITRYRNEIIEKVKHNAVVIVVGQTGCGKSTQVPQYLHKSRDTIGIGKNSLIACLHPRTLAAMTLAERVSKENGTVLGDVVGYRVRFYNEVSDSTRILYMTAGYMTRLLNNKSTINAYGVVIIDEAHERSVQIDVVMGQMKMIMRERGADGPRLVVMSATMNVDEILAYYPGAAIVRVTPANDRVDVIYRPIHDGGNYVRAVRNTVEEIMRTTREGHVLVFVPSEVKVWNCIRELTSVYANATVLPLYGAMNRGDKMKVFKEYCQRKVIVATNIAETSLTIDNVRYVVDTGFVKRVRYDHKTRVDQWSTERVSAAEAEQRKGRTGRTGDGRGVCYRLYEQYDFREALGASLLAPFVAALERRYSPGELRLVAENLASIVDDASLESVCASIDDMLAHVPRYRDVVSERYPVAEISTVNLDAIVLTLKAMRVNIAAFPFIVRPTDDRVAAAIARLKSLSLLEDNGNLTPLGTECARLPLSPALAKVAVLASDLPCREDVFIIIAVLSSAVLIKSRRGRSSNGEFDSSEGDLIAMLNIYGEAEENNFDEQWCKINNVNHPQLRFAELIVWQLHRLLRSPFPGLSRELHYPEDRLYYTKMAFLCGFFDNLTVRSGQDDLFALPDDRLAALHQHSCVNRSKAQIVLALSIHTATSSSDLVLKHCMVYDKQMLNEMDPREWRIRVNLWNETMKFVSTKRNTVNKDKKHTTDSTKKRADGKKKKFGKKNVTETVHNAKGNPQKSTNKNK